MELMDWTDKTRRRWRWRNTVRRRKKVARKNRGRRKLKTGTTEQITTQLVASAT
jgi:hypothetical protein